MRNETTDNRRFRADRSQLSHALRQRYLIALFGFAAGFAILVLLAWWACRQQVWQPTDPLYQALQGVKDSLGLWACAGMLIGWILITNRFFQKPLRYLDELVAASARLASPDERKIELSPPMREVQDELNLVREQALRNQMAAREAEKRKNDLVVYLAHDLKTPLTSVLGYLTLLRDEPQISTELRARYTGVALEKAERLETLLNEFFDITRFNLTQLTLEPETVNLTRMLEQITYEFSPTLWEKRMRWDLQLAPEIQCRCDPDKLGRVFDNLIRNAVHYSDPDTAITVTLERAGGDGSGEGADGGNTPGKGVIVRFANRGRTIPPEKLDRIFEQFFRLDNARSSGTGGSGLGLAIAREIVECHGGTIAASSADGKIEFTVMLPVRGE